MVARHSLFTIGLAVWLCTAACGGGSTPPPPSPGGDGPDPGERVTGTERLGWFQTAPSRQELDGYQFGSYVDGQRVTMARATCNGVDGQTYDCTAPLPQMAVGRHTLELVAVFNGIESARSQPLTLTVGSAVLGMTAPFASAATDDQRASHANRGGVAVAAPVSDRACLASGQCYHLERFATPVADPHALTMLPDGRTLLADRQARIVSVTADSTSEMQVESPCGATEIARVNAIAADPDFGETRLVYIAWSCDSPGALRQLLVVRYRELNDTLGEGATLLYETGLDRADTALAVTRDRRITLSMPVAGEWEIVRFTLTGGVPPENPHPSPVLMRARSPIVLAMGSGAREVLVTDGEAILRALPSGRELARLPSPVSALSVGPDGASLFIADGRDPRTLRSARLSSASPQLTTTPEWTFDSEIAGIGVAPDGSIAVVTRPLTGQRPSSSALFRFVPARVVP